MKAKEVMEKYNITRPTLCAWTKDGKIGYIKLPNGQYDYHEITSEQLQVQEVQPESISASVIDQKLALLSKMAEVELKLFVFLRKINFMGPDMMNELNKLLNEYKALDKTNSTK